MNWPLRDKLSEDAEVPIRVALFIFSFPMTIFFFQLLDVNFGIVWTRAGTVVTGHVFVLGLVSDAHTDRSVCRWIENFRSMLLLSTLCV